MISSRAAAFALALAAAATAPHPAAAEVRAVIVGVDVYKRPDSLKGAVADALDIHASLSRRGAVDLTLMVKGRADVTRESVLRQLDAAIDRAAAGDLVVFSYSGHGARETWGRSRPPDAKAGATHEVLVLGDFELPDRDGKVAASERRFAAERIDGRELQQRVVRIEKKGARALFLIDACYGGGGVRGIRASSRFIPAYAFAEGQDPNDPIWARLPASVDLARDLPGMTFLAAVDRTVPVFEVELPRGGGKSRGALSYFFARAVEGEADAGRDGVITRNELFKYLAANIEQVDASQIPELLPQGDEARRKVVIDFARDFPPAVQAAAPAPVAPIPAKPELPPATAVGEVSPVVRFTTSDGTRVDPGAAGGVEMRPAGPGETADLTYDPRTGRVTSPLGDLIATIRSPGDLAALAAREVALRRLLRLGAPRPWELRLEQGVASTFRLNDRVIVDGRQVYADDVSELYYVMFNIAGDGTVQYLYPLTDKGESPLLPRDRPLSETWIGRPLGSDTAVLVVAPTPLDRLIAALRALDGKVEPLAAAAAVADNLPPGARLATRTIFSDGPPR